ncbi:MAG: class I adenylate-forming enzyme family protein [Lysobacterales bacterium]
MSWFEPNPLLLPQMIANNGQYRADRPALVVGDTTRSWKEFDESTARVANGLHALGLKPGQTVALLMTNSQAMAECLFGVIRAGCVAVPLNVSISDQAVATMINDSESTAVIVTADHQARVDACKQQLTPTKHFICAGNAATGWQHYGQWRDDADSMAPSVTLSPESPCNIIYSSGTTGLPKGIVHSHRCRAAWAYDMAIGLRYHSGARTLLSLGLYSNISWVAMLSTILAGGTMVVMPAFDAGDYLEHVGRLGITHSTVVPVQLQRMLDHPDFDDARLSTLQSLMCCGSPLPEATKQRIISGFGSAFMELYGLTEGLVTILSPEDMKRKTRSVGLPCPGQQINILDDNDELCAVGDSGEIIGRGPLQMSGYHDRPEANEESTWIDAQGKKWLRTGDIGKLDDDGFLYLVDRKKDMILSGGQNVFPADIEAVIAQHPQIIECAVIGVPSDTWGETPLALVVSDHPIDHSEIREWINQRVGKQQRVAGVTQVDELPRNPNGKVLKRELRKAYADWSA